MASAQPTTAKGRATKARVLQSAAELIARRGVAATGLEDVRRAAGVGGSQLTHYFQDKPTLVREVVSWQAARTLQLHRAPEVGGLDSLDSLRTWARLNVEALRARDFHGGCAFGSLAGQLAESGEPARADLAAGFSSWLALLREGLSTMQGRGDLRPDADPDALACLLLAALQGGMLLAQTQRRAEPLEAALSEAIARVASLCVPLT